MSELPPAIHDDRPLTAQEQQLVTWLVAKGGPRSSSFLRQVQAAWVVSRCGCGCASIDFSVDGNLPDPDAKVELISPDYFWHTATGGLCGIFVFARSNQLGGLEVWSVDGQDTPISLPVPDQLRARE